MICSRCGLNAPDGANACPRCGAPIVYQQPQNYGQPAGYGGYPQSAYSPPPAAYGRPKAAPKDGPLAFVPVFMFIIAVFSSLGIFAMPFCKEDHSDSCLNQGLSAFIRAGRDVDCKFLKFMLIAGLVVIGITTVLAIIAAVLAGKRNAPAALNVCAIAFFLNTAVYIANFALYLHFNGDDHYDGKVDLAAAPIVMILLCIGMAVLSLYAARFAKREANS